MRDEDLEQVAALSAQAVWLEPEQGARRSAGAAPRARSTAAPAFDPMDTRRLPATPAQLQLWLANELDPGYGVLNDRVALRLVGDLDVAALRRALTEVVEHHEVLRTMFTLVRGELTQRVVRPYVDVAVVDLTGARWDDVVTHAREESWQPFDLATQPPLRVLLIQGRADESLLLVTLHHIASDLSSPQLLLTELATRYAAVRTGKTATLPESAGYADTAQAQLDRLGADGMDSLVSHWTERLSGASSPVALPMERVARPRDRGRSYDVVIDAELGRATRSAASGVNVSMFALTLTVFRILLWRLTDEPDLLVAAPFTQRFDALTEHVIGPFMNLLALRNRLDPALPVAEAVGAERRTVLTAMTHGQLPYGALVDRARSLGGRLPALPGVVFAYEDLTELDVRMPGLDCEPVDLGPTGSQHDLTVKIMGMPDGSLATRWAYVHLADSAMRTLADAYVTMLRAAVADPRRAIGDITAPLPPRPVPTRNADAASDEGGARPPTTTTERYVAEIWSEVLDLGEIVDAEQSAFSLGAHSLTVARLAARLSEEFDTRITTAEIFQHPTVAAHAELLDARLLASMADRDPEAIGAALLALDRGPPT